MSLREQFLNGPKVRTTTLEVPEIGTVLLRGLSGRAAFELRAAAMDDEGAIDNAKFYPAILIATVLDPATQAPVFEKSDRDALLDLPYGVLDRVAAAALALSGLAETSDQVAEKNSVTTGSSATPSSSPSGSD